MTSQPAPSIAIACGGTGGHLFPGLAVAEQLRHRGCAVMLLISPKEVDQHAVKMTHGMEIVTLPAIGLSRGRAIAFLRGFVRSYRRAKMHFKNRPPRAVLAMGGFTGAPPVLAAKRLGAQTFLHESNAIPGRANRWLTHAVDGVFVGFPQAAARLRHPNTLLTGTPVRQQFHPRDAYTCRVALGLDPGRPVVLVMGGSQGAGGVNELVMQAMPLLAKAAPEMQWLHLAGPSDARQVENAGRALHVKAVVHSFLAEMELALGAATVAISRAGASSIAELAAMRVPAVFIPYPAATDNHQFYNARALEETGAARLLEQSGATAETLARWILELLRDTAVREKMQAALAQWHAPQAAGQIADALLKSADSPVRARERGSETCGQSCPDSAGAERQSHSAA